MLNVIAEIQSICNLKSILGIFIGIFCIICLRKIIGLALRWKNILLSWGYRTLNVPSLWIPDAHVSSDSRQSSKDGPSTLLSNGATTVLSGDAVGSRRRRGAGERVPALRLPDAWPNFLLTWLQLNLDSLTTLCSAWLAAINDELAASAWTRSRAKTDSSQENRLLSPFKLEVTGIRHDRTVPPRLSSVETSASGSTKELHFRCILFSPEVCLQVTLTRSSAGGCCSKESGASGTNLSTPPTITTASSVQVLLHMQQVACRLQLVCLAVERGGTLVLSWDLLSPLQIDRLQLLTVDGCPLGDELLRSDQRWLKDAVYLAIQMAVPHVMFNSSLHIYQHRTLSTLSSAASPRSVRYPILPYSEHLPVSYPPLEALSTELPAGEDFPTGPQPGLHLRIITAILLEPPVEDEVDLQRLEQLCGPDSPSLLHCAIRWNTSWKRSPGPVVSSPVVPSPVEHVEAEGHPAAAGPSRPTIKTPGAHLEPRSWPKSSRGLASVAFRQQQLLATPVAGNDSSDSIVYSVLWNWNALLPLEATGFNLLDVCLFTEPAPIDEGNVTGKAAATMTGFSLVGSAVLPLSNSCVEAAAATMDSTARNTTSPSTQHVVLVDCHLGRRRWSGWTREQQLNDDLVGADDRPVKFMILLKTKLVTEAMAGAARAGHASQSGKECEPLLPLTVSLSPLSSPGLVDTQEVEICSPKWSLGDDIQVVTEPASRSTAPHVAWVRPSNEQLAEFMSDTLVPTAPTEVLCQARPATPQQQLVSDPAQVIPSEAVSAADLPQPLSIHTGTPNASPMPNRQQQQQPPNRPSSSLPRLATSSLVDEEKPRPKLLTRFLSLRRSRRKRPELFGQSSGTNPNTTTTNNVHSSASNDSRTSTPILRTVEPSPGYHSCPKAGESVGHLGGGTLPRRTRSINRFFRFLRRAGDSSRQADR